MIRRDGIRKELKIESLVECFERRQLRFWGNLENVTSTFCFSNPLLKQDLRSKITIEKEEGKTK